MKKIIKIFCLMLLMMMGSNRVYASATCAYIGGDETGVCVGMGEVSIYGGSAKLEEESSNYVLTLNNVNVTDYKLDSDENIAYGIYFDKGNLTIKLEGNNKLNFLDIDDDLVEEYDAIWIEESYNLNIIGEGTLNINANGDYNLIGIVADYINLGEEDKNGPTINANMIGGEIFTTIFISGDFNIVNTNINGNISGSLAGGLYSNDDDTPCNIKNSDINLELDTSSFAVGIYSYGQDLRIEDSDILIKMDNFEILALEVGIAGPENITIKDSRIVIITSVGAADDLSIFNNSSRGSIDFIHTNGKEFLLVTNSRISSNNITYTNIDEEMVYVDTDSLENIKLTSDFNIDDIDNLVDPSYENIVITTGIDNKITNGNNQSIKKNSATSYSVSTNHFRYLIKEIKLDDIVLNEEDYELSKDGKITLTDTGISKLNNLDVGSYKLKLDYYAGNDLEVDFNIVNEIDNPKTIDNIILYIIIGSISLISLIICTLYKKKRI